MSRTQNYLLTLFLLLAFAAVGSVSAGEDVSSSRRDPPTEFAARQAWERFRTHLRGGHMKAAYACFSARSKEAMPYRIFIARYSPITVATQMLLRSPVRTECMHRGDKAVLKHAVTASTNAGPEVVVRIYLVREAGRWRMVVEKAWPAAAREADAREMLRTIRARFLRRMERDETLPGSFIQFRMEDQKLIQSPAFKVLEQVYRFKVRVEEHGNYRITARPLLPDSDLHRYQIDAAGVIRDLTAEDASSGEAVNAP